jgi:hypothetical protein
MQNKTRFVKEGISSTIAVKSSQMRNSPHAQDGRKTYIITRRENRKMSPLQKVARYFAFPIGVATTSFIYSITHDKAKQKVPFLEKIEPFTPAGEGALLTGAISFLANAACTSRASKFAATIVGISAAAFGLKKMQEKEARERFNRNQRDGF